MAVLVPHELRTVLLDRLRLEFEELDELLAKEKGKQISYLNAKGMLHSGAAARLLGQLVCGEMKIRTTLTLTHFLRSAASHGIRIESGMSAEANAFLFPLLDDNFQRITSELFENVPFNNSKSMGSTVKPIMDVLTSAFDREKKRLEHELNDWEMRGITMQKTLPPGQTVVSVMGSHNVVQAGLVGSSAVIVLDREGKDKIRAALNVLQKALEEENTLEPTLKTETKGMIEASKTEVESATPNTSLLKATLNGIASAIQTTASLQPAWQTLRSAMLYIGISV